MPLSPELHARIEHLLQTHHVVLFMKGNPQSPCCGFSAKAAGILNSLVPDYASVDVLTDAEIREGIKEYAQWPTIPQLYVRGELVGGSDIIEQMLNSGELHEVLGLSVPDRTPPMLSITPIAAEAIHRAMEDAEPGIGLHLLVDQRFNSQFQLKPVTGHELVVDAEGIRLHLDLVSASRANGTQIDWIEDERGAGLTIHNPNAPPMVKSMSVHELHGRIVSGTIDVIDVRPAVERMLAPFPQPHEVLDEGSHARLADLPKELPLAFLCHHGHASYQAAEHFRELGFHDLYNVEGGIDVWSTEVDPSVPRY